MREGENSGAAVTGYADCVHVDPSDPANALVALDGELVLRGQAGERVMRAEELFSAPHGDHRRMNAWRTMNSSAQSACPVLARTRAAFVSRPWTGRLGPLPWRAPP